MDKSNAVSLPPLFATLAAMTAVCEIFNLLHFWSTAQRGGGHRPSGPMVNTPVGTNQTCNPACTFAQSHWRTPITTGFEPRYKNAHIAAAAGAVVFAFARWRQLSVTCHWLLVYLDCKTWHRSAPSNICYIQLYDWTTELLTVLQCVIFLSATNLSLCSEPADHRLWCSASKTTTLCLEKT